MFAHKNLFIVWCLFNLPVAATINAAEEPNSAKLLDQAHDEYASKSPLFKIHTSNIPKEAQLSLIAQFPVAELIKESIYLMKRQKDLSTEVEKLKNMINNEIHNSQTTPEESKQKISLLAKNISSTQEKIGHNSCLIETVQYTLNADIALKALMKSDQTNKDIVKEYRALVQIQDKNNQEEQSVKRQLSRMLQAARTESDWILKYQQQGARIEKCLNICSLIHNQESTSKIETALFNILKSETDKMDQSVEAIINTTFCSKQRLEKIEALKLSATVNIRAIKEKLSIEWSQMRRIIPFLNLESKQVEQKKLEENQKKLEKLLSMIRDINTSIKRITTRAIKNKDKLTGYQHPLSRLPRSHA